MGERTKNGGARVELPSLRDADASSEEELEAEARDAELREALRARLLELCAGAERSRLRGSKRD